MPLRPLLPALLILSLPQRVWAVNWAKAMQLYYQDFNPFWEIVITFGAVLVVVGGGVFVSRWRRKRREERIERLKNRSHDYHDAL